MAGRSASEPSAVTLSLAARTLSMHDLPAVPQARGAGEARAAGSSVAVPSAEPRPADSHDPQAASRSDGDFRSVDEHSNAKAAAATAAEMEKKQQQVQQRRQQDLPDSQQSDKRPPAGAARGGRSVKRLTPTTERTESDAADFARRRLSQDTGAPPKSGSSSGSSWQGGAPAAAQPSTGSDSDPDLPADGKEGKAYGNVFSTAASEFLATVPSAALPAAPAPPRQPKQAEPRIYWGAAQAQGDRDHFEDRYRLQPDFQPGVVEQPDGHEAKSHQRQESIAGHTQRCSYAGVFDGHSAADAAQTAASRLHVLLAGELGACKRSSSGGFEVQDVEAALTCTFAKMDFEILSEASRTGARCGSTAVTALQLGSDLYVAHIGDSIAVLDRGGMPEKLTAASDHKVDDPEELRRIRAKGGIVMDGGQRVVSPSGRHSLNMSRALGDADYKTPRRIVSATPDVRRVTLGRRDTVLILATDGLWDVVSEADAISIVANALGGSTAVLKAKASGEAAASLAHMAADALVGVAVNRGTSDNVTAVVGLVRWK